MPSHSTTGKSAIQTARPRCLDDYLWFNALYDSGIQINEPFHDNTCQIDYDLN